MFSPTGKPTLFQGERRFPYCLLVTVLYLWQAPKLLASCTGHVKVKLSDVLILKYLTLRKTFKKLDHDVGVQEFLDASDPSVEELHNQVKVLQSRLTDVEKRLSWWGNSDKINKVEHLTQMECELRESLNAVHVRKLQSMTHLHLPMGSRQEEQTLTCHPANNSQNMPFPEAPNFLTQGDLGCSGDTSVAECSHVLDSGKELELDATALDDLNSIACLRQQLSEPYSYYPYDNLNLLERKSLDPQSEVDLRGYLMDYETQRNFNLPRSLGSGNNSWDSAAGASAAPVLDEKSYPQQEKRSE